MSRPLIKLIKSLTNEWIYQKMGLKPCTVQCKILTGQILIDTESLTLKPTLNLEPKILGFA